MSWSSIIYLIFAFLLTKDFKNKKTAIIVAFLAVIVPWHFMQSRWALDCNLMSAMMLISIYTLCKAKKKIGFLLAGFLFGITLYTYALSYIVIPIFLLGFLIFKIHAKQIKVSQIICMFIPICILSIPLILNLLINMGIMGEIKTPWFSILKMWTFRANEINLNNILHNIATLFKSMFAFDINDYNAFPQFGTLYYISIPFAFIGFIDSIKNIKNDIKNKNMSLDIILFINFISVFICGVLVESGINRINAIYISLIYYIALGIIFVSEKRKYILYGIIAIYLIFFALFLNHYFGTYGKENTNRAFNETTIEVVKYIESNEKFDGKKVNIRTKAIQPYIYTLIANETSPEEFNENLVVNGTVYSYGRYLFYNNTIDDNVVYVLEYNEKLKYDLLELDFKAENFNENIVILYKE